jgi:hypothetical protein
MPHFDELDTLFSGRQGNIVQYLCELNSDAEIGQEERPEMEA